MFTIQNVQTSHEKDWLMELLQEFIDEGLPQTFRYFSTRTVDCLQNHVATFVILEDQLKIVAYAHLDKDENGMVWLGVCVLPSHQKKGLGRHLCLKLIKVANDLDIPTIHLTVDFDNVIAQQLYSDLGFKIDWYQDKQIKMIRNFEKST